MRLSSPVLSIIFWACLSFPQSAFSQTLMLIETTWWKDSETVSAINLSDAQINKIEQIYQDNLKTLTELGRSFNENMELLINLKKADPIDDERLRAQAKKVAEADNELEQARSAMMLSIEDELSEEQRLQRKQIQEIRRASWNFKNLFKGTEGTPAGKTTLPSGEEVYTGGEDIHGPFVVEQPHPPYTYEARRRRIEGLAVMQAVVRKDGSLGNIKVLQSPGYGLGESARKTLEEKWRFLPAKLNGNVINLQVDIEVKFQLRLNKNPQVPQRDE